MISGEIVKLKSENLNKCFSFWDFQNDNIKKKRIADEINTGRRTMFIYVLGGEYVAGFSIKAINEIRAYLAYLVVRENFRNQGIGNLLIDYAIDYSKKKQFREILTQVDVCNINAKRLYEKKGFIPIQEDNQIIKLLKTL